MNPVVDEALFSVPWEAGSIVVSDVELVSLDVPACC